MNEAQKRDKITEQINGIEKAPRCLGTRYLGGYIYWLLDEKNLTYSQLMALLPLISLHILGLSTFPYRGINNKFMALRMLREEL